MADDDDDYSVSCDGVAVDEGGVLYSVAVYTDGEGFNSFVSSDSDLGADDGNVHTELLEAQIWFTDLWRSEAGNLYVSDADGCIHRFDGSAWSVTQVSKQVLVSVWGLSDTEIYTAGHEGVVYRWDGHAWSAISQQLGDVVFTVRGSSGRDLYACGENALFRHFDGTEWAPIELPTNQGLTGLLVLASNDVLVCGAGGVLFRGSGQDWTDLSQSGLDLYAMAQYRGEIYLAAGGDGLFRLEGDEAVNVKDTFMPYTVTANATYLAAAGDTLAVRFDGTTWKATVYS